MIRYESAAQRWHRIEMEKVAARNRAKHRVAVALKMRHKRPKQPPL